MQRNMLRAKLHRVVTTDAELHYIGSCAIDENLLEASDIREYEAIDIWNVTNGERFSTYAIKAERGSGTISVNGSAARRVQVGDLLIIAAFGQFSDDELKDYAPRLVFVDEQNRITEVQHRTPVQK
ncbi:aspartate 1-decarboxylase [Parachitinimonas caeni]|uniref:Aspartate 1-decarboxylase n=1 Tax=Parachitinimonas caeni TaxID=3031301 RepID=A0ABT7DRV8_9NEIS|nr:aspartate 1-decarboxylase [Parachitinimonas caeni]MDK2122812.1 aspartate 1-decarboxylase [Parachitinimonas caeni]